MKAYIFRHGETEYHQGKVSLQEANDLTPEGVQTVIKSTNHLSQRLDKNKPIQISSSPFGRSLYTAKIIQDALSKNGFTVNDIREDDNLSEVGNFEWELFYPLVEGGEIQYGNDKISIDKSLTNPQNLHFIEYFRSDAAYNLSQKAKASLPKNFLERIDSFEKNSSVFGRLDSKLEKLSDTDDVIPIISTHEGLTGKFIEKLANGNKIASLKRGKYFGVKSEGGIWIPYADQKDAIEL